MHFRIDNQMPNSKNRGMAEAISTALRKAIEASGVSHNEIAKATGIPQPTITRFVNGADLRVSNCDALAAYFGLSLSGKRRAGRKRH